MGGRKKRTSGNWRAEETGLVSVPGSWMVFGGQYGGSFVVATLEQCDQLLALVRDLRTEMATTPRAPKAKRKKRKPTAATRQRIPGCVDDCQDICNCDLP